MGVLEGKVAFVTGAARGQGRSHAVRFAQEGADVIAVDLCAPVAAAPYPMATSEDLDETAELVKAEGRRVFTRIVDVRNPSALNQAADDGQNELGVVDVVVANAGIATAGENIMNCPQEVWQEVIDINLTGVFNTIRAGAREMVARASGGSIILISSIMGLRAVGGIPAYTTAKHGLVGLMRTAAHEFAPYQIRCNSVHPTNVRTPMILHEALFASVRPDLEHPTEEDAAVGLGMLNLMPLPWVQPSDITDAVLWLASDASKYVTGVTLPVDLGATIK